MKNLVRWITFVLLSGPAVVPAQAAFSSIYIFGDGVCTTTVTTNQPRALYYGDRFCNGRVWVEVLAQRQGLSDNTITTNWSYSSNNLSYFNDFSSNLVQNVNNFTAPADANTALFVVWVNDADFVGDMGSIYTLTPPSNTNMAAWTSAINQSITNHWQALTNLYYAKGARTLVMPNAVDITEVPEYSGLVSSADKSFIRARVVDFNTGFLTMLNQAKASLPGITIYVPDFFTLLTNMVAYPANYGLINSTSDAIEDQYTNLNGTGASYLFWDELDPTAKAHEIMADITQQLISPVTISNLTLLSGSNRLDVANIPLGLNGFVDGETNVVPGSWTSVANITSTNATLTLFVPPAGPVQYYRLRFPFAWFWP